METLKKIFPFSFKEKKDVTALVVTVIIMVLLGAVCGIFIAFFSKFPLIGWTISLAGSLIDLYVTASIVLTFLDYFMVIK